MSIFSVIIPCYNASNYIQSCLDSFERQARHDFEVIIVDDCSTDSSVELLESVLSSYSYPIQLIKNKTNRGPSYARKVGAQNANSTYLAFCDSDDWFCDNFAEEVYESIKIESPDLILFGYNMICGDGRIRVHKLNCENVANASKELLFLTGINALWSLVVKKELFLNVEHTDLRNGEDMAIIPLLFAKAEKGHVLSTPLYNYNSRNDSISNTSSLKVVDSLLSSFEHVRNNMPKDFVVFEEYIGVSRVLYGVILNLMKVGYDRKKAHSIARDFTHKYPSWKKNPYLKTLPLTRRVFIWFIGHNLTIIPWLMTKLHSIMIR